MVDGSTRSETKPFPILSGIPGLVILFTILAFNRGDACPFCLSPPQTLAEQILRADVVLIAELVRFEVLDFGNRAESTLRIREFVRGEDLASQRNELAPGQCITVSDDFSAQRGDFFLMYGELPDTGPVPASSTFTKSELNETGDSLNPVRSVIQVVSQSSIVPVARIERAKYLMPELIAWNETTAVSPEAVAYIRQIPSEAIGQTRRLAYFMKYLEHPDPLIAIDAWAEFGNSVYKDVVAVRHHMSRENLRKWISDPAMFPERLGLYGMMLGLCGNSEDAEFLKLQLGDPLAEEFRFGADGLMAGYLLLTGESGLAYLEETRVTPPGIPATSDHSLVQALEFIWSYEKDLITEQRLLTSMRLFLQHESMREIVITNLSRWEDWSSLPILVTMFDGECSDDRLTQRAILQYAQTCAKSGTATVTPHGHAMAAAEFLSRVRTTNPDLLNTSEREFRAPQQADYTARGPE